MAEGLSSGGPGAARGCSGFLPGALFASSGLVVKPAEPEGCDGKKLARRNPAPVQSSLRTPWSCPCQVMAGGISKAAASGLPKGGPLLDDLWEWLEAGGRWGPGLSSELVGILASNGGGRDGQTVGRLSWPPSPLPPFLCPERERKRGPLLLCPPRQLLPVPGGRCPGEERGRRRHHVHPQF